MQKQLGNQPAYSKILFCLLILVTLPQCTTTGKKKGVTSDEILRPLKDIRRAVNYSLRDRVKNRSENGRTYFSKYHRPGKDLRLSAYKQKERAQVVITILGDRRPYTVSVYYKIDQLNGRKYKFNRYDKDLASMYLERVETYLAGRPEERDVIDDFRPY